MSFARFHDRLFQFAPTQLLTLHQRLFYIHSSLTFKTIHINPTFLNEKTKNKLQRIRAYPTQLKESDPLLGKYESCLKEHVDPS